jgi:alpha-tubulin suppressor-like RCC1 family protein
MKHRLLTAFLALALLLTGHASANTGDSFGGAPIVRLHALDSTKNDSGILVGVHLYGNLIKLVVLAADHTARRMGTMIKISFGDDAGSILVPGGSGYDLILANVAGVRTFTNGANGTTDVSLIGLTIDRGLLQSDAERAFLSLQQPATLAVTPAAPFTFQCYTFGTDGDAFPGFGFRNKFSNVVDTIAPFTGSYTTDAANNPLIYTQKLCQWDFDTVGGVPGEGAVGAGGAGSPMVVNGSVVGIQVNGATTPGSVSYGLAWDAADVAWLNGMIDELLAGGNELSFLATSAGALPAEFDPDLGALTPVFQPNITNYTQTTTDDHLTCFPIRLEPGSIVQSKINDGSYFTVDAKPPISTGGISSGSHSWAIRANGSLASWGHPDHGAASVPPNLINVKAISVGGWGGVTQFEDDSVSGWGGYISTRYVVPPVPLIPSGLTRITQMYAGSQHTFLLDADGVLKGYGPNNTDLGPLSVPAGLTNVIAIATGTYHVLALKRDGTVAAWGGGGGLGWQGEVLNVPAGLNNVVAIAASDECSVALQRDGTVVVWGSNYSGQNNVPSFPQTPIVAIAASDRHVLVLYKDGGIGQWGSQTPILPHKNFPGSFAKDVVGISCFFNTFFAQHADGSVTGWGYNAAGAADPPADLTVSRSSATPRMALNPGLNTVEFKVTPPSGRYTQTYKIKVTRLVAAPPTIANVTATATDTTATLSAVVNPQGQSTETWAEFGTAPDALGHNGSLILPASFSGQNVTFQFIGRDPGTQYFYRFRAANGKGFTYSPVMSFTTILPRVPTISSLVTQEVLKHGVSPWLDFTVGPGPYAGEITVTATSGNSNLLLGSGVEFDGAASGAARRLRLKPVCGQTGAAVVTLTATLDSLTVTTSFTVNVVDRPPADPAEITGLGFLPSFGFGETLDSKALQISGDGNVVAGRSTGRTFRWTATGGMEDMNMFSGYETNRITQTGISFDGAIIGGYLDAIFVGMGQDTAAYLWGSGSSYYQALPDSFQLNGLSGDGSVAVGHQNDPVFHSTPDQPVRWTEANGIEYLDKGGSAVPVSATNISSDGSTIVGYAGYYYPGFYSGAGTSACYWPDAFFAPSQLRTLDPLPGGLHARANAASADGGVIVGYSDSAAQPGVPKAVRWVREGFTWQNLYSVHELDSSLSSIATEATAVSADGSRIVGTIGGGFSGGGTAFVWDAENGQQVLQTALIHGGANVNAGWSSLDEANGISADGLYIVGTGTRASFQKEAFRAKLPLIPPTPTISAIADVTIPFNTTSLPIPFTLADADSNPDCLGVSVSISSSNPVPPQNIVLGGMGANRTITVTPAQGQSGQVMIILTVSDGSSSSDQAFVLTVNTPPAVLPQTVTTNAGTLIEITPSGTDADGHPLTFSISTQPVAAMGAVIPMNQKFVFTPSPSFYGSATFQFRANDGFDYSAPATVTVNVLGGLPTVTTLAPSPLTTVNATLRATVQPNLFETTASFIVDGVPFGYVIVPAGSTEVEATKPAGSGTGLPLLPGTAHTCRVDVLSLAGPIVEGNVVNFTMLGGPPTVTTNAPIMITPTKATLRATVNPNEVDTTVTFYLGGVAIGSVGVPAGTAPQNVSFNYTTLIPGQALTFSASAANTSNQIGNGSNQNFNLLTSDSTIGNANNFLYAANAGWINAKPATSYGFRTSDTVCSGFLYAANFGWIHAGTGEPANGQQYSNTGSDYGINVFPDGSLRGFAWSGNIGWIAFESIGNPAINLGSGALSGYAWSGNIGWINLGTATTTQLAILDTDGDGISDAWEREAAGNLTTLAANRDTDGDGVSDLDEFTADTDPANPRDRFKVANEHIVSGNFIMSFPSLPTRFYRIETSLSLAPPWNDVGLGWFQGSATGTTTADLGDPPEAARFYRVAVKRPLTP